MWRSAIGFCVVLASAPVLAQPSVSAVAISPSDAARRGEVAVAQWAATRGVTLERLHAWPAASGTVVRYRQRLEGTIVRDGGIAVLVDRGGDIVALNDFTATLPAILPAVTVTPERAARTARIAAGGADPGDDVARTYLTWTAEFGPARRVYECDFTALAPTLPSAPRVLVDAATGAVLRVDDRVRMQRARLFSRDPLHTPEPTLVDLAPLDAPGAVLRGADVDAFNCIDHGTIVESGGSRFHLCTPEHRAAPDASGLFAFATTDPRAVDDSYAELSGYHHVTEQIAFFRRLGLTNLRSRPFRVIANVRFPAFTVDAQGREQGEGPLRPYPNAGFIPQTPANVFTGLYGEGQDALILGQASMLDFGWDGSVVAHEVGHAAIASTSDFGVSQVDEWGTNIAGRALGEGNADYFAAARFGDPDIHAYIAAEFPGRPFPPIDRAGRYPDVLNGEEHQDGAPFGAALWTSRGEIGATFDAMAFEAVLMASPRPTQDGMAQLVIAAVQRTAGNEAAMRVRDRFAAFGLETRRARVIAQTSAGATIMVPTAIGSALSMVPGSVQMRYQTSTRSDTVIIRHAGAERGVRFFVRRNEPVTFEYASSGAVTVNSDAEAVPGTVAGESIVQGLGSLAPGTMLFVAHTVAAGPAEWMQMSISTNGEMQPARDGGGSTADAGTPVTNAYFIGCSVREQRSGRAPWLPIGMLMVIAGIRRGRRGRSPA